MIRYTIARTEKGLWQIQDGVNPAVVVDSPTLAAWIEDQLSRAYYLVVAVPERKP
jgi:hypothetical protein